MDKQCGNCSARRVLSLHLRVFTIKYSYAALQPQTFIIGNSLEYRAFYSQQNHEIIYLELTSLRVLHTYPFSFLPSFFSWPINMFQASFQAII